jgi:DNA-binding response OmpR family regulator
MSAVADMMATRRRRLLLVEPSALFRRTVVLVARELDLADIDETSSHDTAREALMKQAYDGLLLDLGDGLQGMEVLQQVRHGRTRCATSLPVAVTAAACDTATVALLREQGVQRILLKPFKVRNLLEVVATLSVAPA